MSESHSTDNSTSSKPAKPSSDFPLTAHNTGRWCKKIKGRMHYFGTWADPEGALREYQAFREGGPVPDRRLTSTNPNKPSKPYPEFPLTAHPAGYWCKKIRGKVHYFGKWADPDAALAKYLEQKDALHSGRKPRPDAEGFTVKQLCNAFLIHKKALMEAGELSPRTWQDYFATAALLLEQFGKQRIVSDLGPDDFAELRKKLSKTRGPHFLAKTIQVVRCVFKYSFDSELVDRPVRFGPGFKRPSKNTFRRHKAKQGKKLFNADEIHNLLGAAGIPLKAMILLGINCGYGNSDCANLPLSSLDLDRGWVDYPRPKTGIPRRCPLWPETMDALKESLAKRPEPKDPVDAGLVFITKYGFSWSKDIADSPITKELRKLLDKLKINGHRNFYALRHTFRTVADESKDQPATDYIMGHESPHMSSVYRERISDERLQAVVDYVRGWLFGKAQEGDKADVLPMAKAK